MQRRGFITGLASVGLIGLAAPAVVKAEGLMRIWVPKSLGNRLLTSEDIMREAVRLFKNSNYFIDGQVPQWDAEFAKAGERIGTTLRIRLPNDYRVMDPTA